MKPEIYSINVNISEVHEKKESLHDIPKRIT